MAFPGARLSRRLYDDAKRIVDEQGKGQEVLRTAKARAVAVAGGIGYDVFDIPQVDIRLVNVRIIGEGVNFGTEGGSIDVLAPAALDTAPGATNQLITQITSAATVPDDTIAEGALTALAARVDASQPVVLAFATGATGGAGTVWVFLDYILADEDQVSYQNYG